MTYQWYEAAGGMGLLLASSSNPGAEWHFAGLIRTESKNKYSIERWDGATDVCATDVQASLAAAQARLLTMVGAEVANG